MIEQLKEYPALIRDLELEHFDYLQEKAELEEKLMLFNAELELEIAEDPSLRNEQMRKAQKVISQKINSDYQEMLEAVGTLQGRIARSQVILDCRKREFSVLKLEKQLEIAKQELVA